MLNFEAVITSRQNPTVKRICALSEKKKRYADRLFRFDGIKLLREAIAADLELETVVVCEDISDAIASELSRFVDSGELKRELILAVSPEVFEKISEERSPEGILTVARFEEKRHRRVEDAEGYSLDAGESILIAQSLRDAGNLGTVIRSCAALGIDRLVISDDCADLYNPKTIRAAMGGLFTLNIDMIPCERMASAIRSLRKGGRRIYAAALHTKALNVGEIALARGDAFVIGNEGHGLPSETIEACDACAIIPMREGSESLNAAAAAAICIWETVRGAK